MDTTTLENEPKTHVETAQHTTHHRHKKMWSLSTPLAILLGAVILGVSHLGYALVLNTKSSGPVTLFAGAPVTEKDYPTGNTKSDVVVVEYSDTECPFCARLHPAMMQIQSEYNEKVSFVYRYFPLTQIHPGAFAEAQAIECIGRELGAKKRREYVDQMFQYKISNNSMTLPKNGKEDLAKNFGVNMTTFTECLQSEESSKVVSDAIQDGVNAGVSGTPATFVLKRDGDEYEIFALIEGAREYDYVKAVIEAALK